MQWCEDTQVAFEQLSEIAGKKQQEKATRDKDAVGELSALASSDDFAAVCSAVDKYSGHASPAVRSACGAVTKRRDAMIEDMRARLSEACTKLGISESEELLSKSEPYAAVLESEQGTVQDRVEVLRVALSAMKPLLDSSDIDAMSAALAKYEGFPGECAATRAGE